MATNNKIKIVNSFADDTTRDIEFSGFDSDCSVLSAATLKARIAAINSDTSTFDAFYLSDGGQTFTAITGATITKITENEINLNVSE